MLQRNIGGMVGTGTEEFRVPSYFGAEPMASPSTAATRPATTGFLAGMRRLWREHSRRVAEFGILPL